MLKLYHSWNSANSRKVRQSLAEKRLNWVSHHVDLLGKRDNLKPWYAKLNPNNEVPTLVHEGRIVIESNVILEYLEDTFPQVPLRPADTHERALMRNWMDKAEHVLRRNLDRLSCSRALAPRQPVQLKETRRRQIMLIQNAETRAEQLRRLEHRISMQEEEFAKARLAEALDEMERALQVSPWLCGASFSLADIAIAPYVEHFGESKLDSLTDRSARPAVGDWWARIQTRPGFALAYAFRKPKSERGEDHER